MRPHQRVVQDMTVHQDAIDELDKEKEEVQGREATAEDKLKASKKTFGKLHSSLTSAEKVFLPTSFLSSF